MYQFRVIKQNSVGLAMATNVHWVRFVFTGNGIIQSRTLEEPAISVESWVNWRKLCFDCSFFNWLHRSISLRLIPRQCYPSCEPIS